MQDEHVMRRLLAQHETHGGLTVAVDFDNTLYDYHFEAEKRLRKEYDFSELHKLLVRLKAAGCFIIIWTANDDEEFVRRFLAEREIPYDVINQNPPYFRSTSRKIFYNVLLDDAAGLRETYLLLCRFLELITHPNH